MSTSFFNENSITAFRTSLATRENEASIVINSSGGHMAPLMTANSPLRRSRRRHREALRTSPQGQSALRSNTAACRPSPRFPRAGAFLKLLQFEEDTTQKTASSPRSGYAAMSMLFSETSHDQHCGSPWPRLRAALQRLPGRCPARHTWDVCVGRNPCRSALWHPCLGTQPLPAGLPFQNPEDV